MQKLGHFPISRQFLSPFAASVTFARDSDGHLLLSPLNNQFPRRRPSCALLSVCGCAPVRIIKREPPPTPRAPLRPCSDRPSPFRYRLTRTVVNIRFLLRRFPAIRLVEASAFCDTKEVEPISSRPPAPVAGSPRSFIRVDTRATLISHALYRVALRSRGGVVIAEFSQLTRWESFDVARRARARLGPAILTTSPVCHPIRPGLLTAPPGRLTLGLRGDPISLAGPAALRRTLRRARCSVVPHHTPPTPCLKTFATSHPCRPRSGP